MRRIFMKRVLFPGSFDPFTEGHIALVLKVLEKADQVVIAVGDNVGKNPLFDKKTRVRIIQEVIAYYLNCYYARQRNSNWVNFESYELTALAKIAENPDAVVVQEYVGLTVDYIIDQEITHIMRGERNGADSWEEQRLDFVNQLLMKTRGRTMIPTEIVETPRPDLKFVSSTDTKKLAARLEFAALQRYVAPPACEALAKYFLEEYFVKMVRESDDQERQQNARSYFNSCIAPCHRDGLKNKFSFSKIATMLNYAIVYNGHEEEVKNFRYLQFAILHLGVDNPCWDKMFLLNIRQVWLKDILENVDANPLLHDLQLLHLVNEGLYSDESLCCNGCGDEEEHKQFVQKMAEQEQIFRLPFFQRDFEKKVWLVLERSR